MSNKPSVVYANVWEDPELNRLSLFVKPGDSVLSITSGGCNSLCLLLDDPARVVSIDLNPAQLAMLEFKRAAIMELDYEDFLEALGVPFLHETPRHPPEYRVELYRRIKRHMPPYAVQFWDENQDIIRKGIFLCGKVEAFFALYRRILGFLYDFGDIEKLCHCSNLEEQKKMYKNLRKRRWRFLNSVLLNKFVLSLVKGAHSFAQVEDPDLAGNLSRKIDKAMTTFFNPENFFLCVMLLGGHHSRKHMSPYLLEENYPRLKRNIGRLEIFEGTVGDVLRKNGKGTFDKFNLSNIFEWMTNEIFNGVIREVLDLARPGSRLCYRYTLAKPRLLNSENSARLVSEPDLALKLFNQDRSFIYESFHVFHLA